MISFIRKQQNNPTLSTCFWVQMECKIGHAVRVYQGFGQALHGHGGFRLKVIFAIAPATSKNDARFKSGQK